VRSYGIEIWIGTEVWVGKRKRIWRIGSILVDVEEYMTCRNTREQGKGEKEF
jgi:hypothetical protein